MTQANPQVDQFLKTAKKWQAEMTRLRAILRQANLAEEFKWGKPCYSYQGTNVVIMASFKEHCALIFCKGALLKDPAGILIRPGEQTQAARQMRISDLTELKRLTPPLKQFLKQAIAVEKAGVEITYKKIEEYALPAELSAALAAEPGLKSAFQALTPGRQRAYLIFFGSAKQAATRAARIQKCRRQSSPGRA